MAELASLYLPAPYEGLDLSVPPHDLSQTRAWRLSNWLVHEDRRLPLRGPVLWRRASAPLSAGGSALSADDVIPVSAYAYRQRALVSLLETPGTWPWRAFDGVSGAAPQLATGAVYAANLTSWTTLAAGDGLAGPAHADYLGAIYYVGVRDSVGTLTYLSRTHRLNPIEKFDPDTEVVTAVSPAPQAAQGLANYAERLFVLGGTTPGTATGPLRPHSLWYTNPGQDPATLGNWQTSGVANQILVGEENASDYGLGLCSLGQTLLIFKRHSVWTLVGSGSETFNVRDVSRTTGLVDPRAVVVVDDVAYYVSERGLARYDGAEGSLLSGPVDAELLPALRQYGATDSPGTSFVTLSALPRGYLKLEVGDVDTVAWGALFHIPSGRWARFESSARLLAAANPGSFFIGLGRGHAYDLTYLTDATAAAAAGEALGHDTHEAASVGFDATVAFPPTRPAAPFSRMAAARIGLEYSWQRTGGDPAAHPILRSQRYMRGDGDDQAGPTAGPVAGDVVATPDYRPSVAWTDSGAEASDLYLEVTRDAGVSEDLVRAEVLGALLEYQSPTQRRS